MCKTWLIATLFNIYNSCFATEFACQEDSHCNEKGSCNNVLGNCACEEGWNSYLDCTFCKFRINALFQKVSLSAAPSSGQLEHILPGLFSLLEPSESVGAKAL